jgi:hypothetical protein
VNIFNPDWVHINTRIFMHLIFSEQFVVSYMYSVGIAKMAVRDWTNRPQKKLGVFNRTKGFPTRTLC